MTYNMSFDNNHGEFDKVYESEGIKIFCDLKSWLYLKGTNVYYSEDMLTGGFKINNPNASRGRGVNQRTCAVCHVMHDEGGKIGPELTGSNRADTDYILLNILDPNYDVPEGYRMVTITGKDGRVYAGNVTEEDNAKVVLTMVGQTSVISKADIKTRLVSKISLMPEGLLLTLKDKEFLDLIKYLRTEKQVELPKQ